MDTKLSNLIWAKSDPFKSLKQHMRETGLVAEVILNESVFSEIKADLAFFLGITEKEAVNFSCYMAAVHDIGKCHPLFQIKDSCSDIAAYLKDNGSLNYPFTSKDYRHEIGSETALIRIWKKENRVPPQIRKDLACVLKIHHQGKSGKDYKLKDEIWPSGEEWIIQQDMLEEYFFEKYRPVIPDCGKIRNLDAACVILTGVIILSDWIASGLVFRDTEECDTDDCLRELAKRFIISAGIGESRLPEAKSFSDLFPWIDKSSQRPLQNAVEETFSECDSAPLITVIEAPMGEGKTEAGMFAAVKMAEYWRKKGLYVALPTSATANQMVGRVERTLKEHSIGGVRLMHGLSWLLDDELYPDSMETEEIEALRWLMSSKRTLLAPYAVGTVDQVMMAALKVRYGLLRILGLTEKALIIDEVHAYDAYMSSILERLLEWCRTLKIPVVLLSATLPLWKKKQMLSIYGNPGGITNHHQAITCGFDDGKITEKIIPETTQKKTVRIRYSESKNIVDAVTNEVSALKFEKGCVCIIANTVKNAQSIYREIRENSSCRTLLFHSRFPVYRRNEIEQECLDWFGPDKSRRPEKAVLVATQVVEQSLDLDFDYMITEIAPVDLLLQRSGRLHRHADTERPEQFTEPVLSVMSYENNEFGATEKIYYKLLLDRSAECIRAKRCIQIPEDIPSMVDYVYQKDTVNEEEKEQFIEKTFDEEKKEGFARNLELWRPSDDGFGLIESGTGFEDDGDNSWVMARTRLSDKTLSIAILPEELYREAERQQAEWGRISQKLAKEIIMFSCSVSEKQFKPYLSQKPLFCECLNGTGRLKDMIFYRADDGDDLRCTLEDGVILFDNNEGLILKKGRDQHETLCAL